MRRTTESESSWVTFRDRTFVSRHASKAPHCPHSSLTRLVQGVWETETAMARAILRRRIFTTGALGPMELGMVRTAAQRVSAVEGELAPAPGQQRVSFENGYSAPGLTAGQEALSPAELADALAAGVRRSELLRASDRPVGCVLVDAAGARLAWANNTNAANRTCHAEVNLAQAWWASQGRRFPPGAVLYTTLEPCRMCQGMLAECGPDLSVRYAVPDGMPRVTTGLAMHHSPRQNPH